MKRKTYIKIVLFLIIIVIFSLIAVMLILLETLKKEEQQSNYNSTDISVITTEVPISIEGVFEKHNSKLIQNVENRLYAELQKDLYSENGESNKNFFEQLIKDLIPFFEKESFYIIDQSKFIDIYIKYNLSADEYTIIINDNENFYSETDGQQYERVKDSVIVQGSNFYVNDYYLNTLRLHDMFFSSIKDKVGEPVILDDGYEQYFDGAMKLRKAHNNTVKNVVFSEKYNAEICKGVKPGTHLSDILEINPKLSFGSIKDGFLGYRQEPFYVFCYDDEISVYVHEYEYNKEFEDELSDYLETKNLENFVNRLTSRWQNYDILEYDFETQSAYILYANRGIEINIENNESKGITLYSNYFFTDVTRQFVKNGLITFDYKHDLIYEIEMKRRENR